MDFNKIPNILLHLGRKGQKYNYEACKNDLKAYLKEMLSIVVDNKLSISQQCLQEPGNLM